ncbi:ABC transporter ATP-binding protein [Miniphocaeibacter massiliensis]|uniref:ABC transporter ATP-binding protein n=1 Tax=Miniphocaeibacter massiliensis TaxID=2041841 RepID=UPI000C1B9720|nr:ATP-binding cassette domain-containing protein [Miniphocaeibacter massiliensis]
MTEIIIDNLSKTIKNNVVLKDISLEMKSGLIYGLQGINGSGKTMLMRSILGLIRATKGTVKINRKVIGKDIEFPEDVGFLLESPTFLNRYSGFKNLKMLNSIKNKISDDEIKDVLKLVGLSEDAWNKKYGKYSLGMKQRLGIAASIMEKPDIVIMDEPTNALDSSGVELVKNILQEQKKRGALVIVSCHDTAILEKLSDEIIKMEMGSIIDHLYLNNNEELM